MNCIPSLAYPRASSEREILTVANELSTREQPLRIKRDTRRTRRAILHHKEMMPQFDQRATYRLNWDNIAVGLTMFILGLFKKTVIADDMAGFATPAFSAAAAGTPLTLLEAWGAALAYTFQIYFDFSGYTDMALGASRMFGIILPLNFCSPYKASSIIDFWRRWHITLSRFLRDYVYIAVGGNRTSSAGRYRNLLLTMLIGGLWHGAEYRGVKQDSLSGRAPGIDPLTRLVGAATDVAVELHRAAGSDQRHSASDFRAEAPPVSARIAFDRRGASLLASPLAEQSGNGLLRTRAKSVDLAADHQVFDTEHALVTAGQRIADNLHAIAGLELGDAPCRHARQRRKFDLPVTGGLGGNDRLPEDAATVD